MGNCLYLSENDSNQTSTKQSIELAYPGQYIVEPSGNLQNDLKKLQTIYGANYKELLHRKFISIDNNNHNLKEEYINHNSIKIMQFNILADGLSTCYNLETTDKSFVGISRRCLEWRYRGLRIIEEIVRFKPDIICIEECDQLPYIMKYLIHYNYNYYFQEKSQSPIKYISQALMEHRIIDENDDMPYDGVAIIYNENKLEIIQDIFPNKKNVSYSAVQKIDMSENKEKVFALGIPFRCLSMEEEVLNKKQCEFLVIATHCKSTKTFDGEKNRVKQINALLNRLIKNPKNLPIVLCADLNANPIKHKSGYDPLCYNYITKDQKFESVYALANNGKEPEYTTWKERPNGSEKHVLDYIFLKNGAWNVTAILDIPKPDESNGKLQNSKGFIPNWYYPSDHFSICAQLTWNPK